MPQEITPINLGAVNCYLIKVNDGFVLIDSGGCTILDTNLQAIRERLESELERLGCRPGNLKLILITHGDCDHTGNCAYLREKYKTAVAVHTADSYMVEKGVLSGAKIRSLVMKLVVFLLGFNKSKLQRMMSKFERFEPDLRIDEGFDVARYGFAAQVLHLPGHTKGSIGILTPDGSLICGDIMENIWKPGVTFLVDDIEELDSSIDRLRKLDIKMVYPGHGKAFPMSAIKQVRKQ